MPHSAGGKKLTTINPELRDLLSGKAVYRKEEIEEGEEEPGPSKKKARRGRPSRGKAPKNGRPSDGVSGSQDGALSTQASTSVLSETASWPGEIGGALPAQGGREQGPGKQASLEVQGCTNSEAGHSNPLVTNDGDPEGELECNGMQVDKPVLDGDAEKKLPEAGAPSDLDPDALMYEPLGTCGDISDSKKGPIFFSGWAGAARAAPSRAGS